MAVPPGSLPLVCAYLSAVLIGPAWSEGACLQDGRHKATPTPEPHLTECGIYRENSCCSQEHVLDLAPPPLDLATPPGSSPAPWDKCGALSPACESYLKRVVCFHRCSPDAALWPRPQPAGSAPSPLWPRPQPAGSAPSPLWPRPQPAGPASLRGVPLCHSFCRDWYEACSMEMTCARDWTRDPRGHNCSGSCVPYHQMYQHGRDLCESLWGEAFVAVDDEEEEKEEEERGGGGGGGRGGRGSCGCLTLGPSDRHLLSALRGELDSLDTTKSGVPQKPNPNHPNLNPNHPNCNTNHPNLNPSTKHPNPNHPNSNSNHPISNTNHPNPNYPNTNHPNPNTNHPNTNHPNSNPNHPISNTNHPNSNNPNSNPNLPNSNPNHPSANHPNPNPQYPNPNPQYRVPCARPLRPPAPAPPAPRANAAMRRRSLDAGTPDSEGSGSGM